MSEKSTLGFQSAIKEISQSAASPTCPDYHPGVSTGFQANERKKKNTGKEGQQMSAGVSKSHIIGCN